MSNETVSCLRSLSLWEYTYLCRRAAITLPQLTEHGRQSPTLQDAQAGRVQNSSVATYTALVQYSLLTGMPSDVSIHVMALCLRPVPHVTEHYNTTVTQYFCAL